MIKRLSTSLPNGLSSKINTVTNEEMTDWYLNINDILIDVFPANHEFLKGWNELLEQQRSVVTKFKNVKRDTIITENAKQLRKSISYLRKIQTQSEVYITRQENSKALDTEDNPFKIVLKYIYKKPKWIKRIAIIILVFAIVCFSIWQSLPDNTKQIFIEKYFSGSTLDTSRKDNNDINIKNTLIYNDTPNIELKKALLKEQKTIMTVSINSNSLQKWLELKGFTIDNFKPNFRINIVQIDGVENLPHSNLYRFNGGGIKIELNGTECIELNEFKLEPTFEGGNTLSFVKNALQNNIEKLVSENIEHLGNAIVKCIQ